MNNNEDVQAVQVSPEVIYQQDKATVDMQVATAHQYPRNIQRAVDNAIAVVVMDEETAKSCTYALSRGGKPITGPSVNLAKILAQTWGNMRVQAKVISIEDKQITSQAIAWDLESNLAIQVEVKRSIYSKSSGRYSDDMITMTGNAANSIALRNAIYSVIPKAVVDKTYKAAQAKITGNLSDETALKAKRKQVIEKLKGTYQVTDEEILFAIGKASVDHIDADDIVVLIGIGTAIKDGDTTVEEAFKRKPVAVKSTVPKADKEKERILLMIQDSTLEDLPKLAAKVKGDPALQKAYDEQKATLEALSK